MTIKPVGWLGQDADRHDHCYPNHKTIEASPDVLAEGCRVVRVGDAVANHGGSCSKHRTPHGGKVQKGSASVFVNGKPMAREGDTVKCATGQTAPLLRGRATVAAGDSSPVAGAGSISSRNAPAEPAADDRDPRQEIEVAGAPRQPDHRDKDGLDKARVGEIEAFLAPSPTGRAMLQFLKEHNIDIVFEVGGGDRFDRSDGAELPRGRITLDPSGPIGGTAMALMHEGKHAMEWIAGSDPWTRIDRLSSTEYIRGMMQGEVEANLMMLKVMNELMASGKLSEKDEYVLLTLPESFTQDYSYRLGRHRGAAVLNQKNPNATKEELERAAQAGARKEMLLDYLEGRMVTSINGRTYLEYYEEGYSRHQQWLYRRRA